MGQVLTGTPFTGYVSLTNAAPGPTALALFDVMGQAAFTLAGNQRLYITNISISTSDTAMRLVTVDTGGTTPTKLASAYLVNTFPPYADSIAPGECRGIFGVAPRASAPAVTAATTIEVVVKGYVSSS